ncbi:fibronectin type III domain-containing protein [Listeria fleischmannii]|uniref:Chitinase B n=1 Tax=Listeria fleischmannii FSL S10-1203 TaxID=1265822 RepID=W7DQH3_9LIST|nr:fibronectin type III domain-containing protein [Listeria fleischmannii]EUJ64742.1 chitinase B [Listeria fleischmannii FSL S10-1203]
MQNEGLTDTSINLFWAISPYADSYKVYVNDEEPKLVEQNRINLTGLTPGEFYSIQIAAVNQHGEGAKSEVFIQKTKVEAAVLQPFKMGDPYLLGTGAVGDTITSCRLYNADGTRYITTGTVTNGALKIYLNNNANIVEGEQYTVKVVDGDPKTVPLLSDAEGMPVTFTVLPAT